MKYSKTTKEELALVLEEGEGYTLEFKQNVNSDLSKELVAFANASGGRIFIGVNDHNEIVGIAATNKIISQIQNMAAVCDPPVAIEIEKLVSGLLHNTPIDKLDNTHAAEHQGLCLRNLYPSNEFLTFMHSNILLVIHSEKIDAHAFKKFKFGLFRTYCALRGCWHIYNLTNEQLDKCITDLSIQLNDLINRRANFSDFVNKEEEIIKIKIQFLRSQSFEDPLIRGIGMTPFDLLYDEGKNIYRIDELLQNIRYKMEQVDKLFEIVSSHISVFRFNRLSHSQKPIVKFIINIAITGIIIAIIMFLFPIISPSYLKWIITVPLIIIDIVVFLSGLFSFKKQKHG